MERSHANRMWKVGATGLTLWLGGLITWGVLQPTPYAQGWRLILELAFLGRAVNIADGVTNGFGSPYLLLQSGPQDILLMLVVLPLVVLGTEGSRPWPWIGPWLAKTRASAEVYARPLESFGALGLFCFVFFPFWSTGTLVGSVVGYLLGIRVRVILLTASAAHLLSVVSLIYFFDAIQALTGPLNEGLAKYMPWAVVAFLVAVGALIRTRVQREQQSGN
jgi:hypothetical protein